MSMAAVLHSFGYSLDFLREQVALLTPEQMVAHTDAVKNHPAWTIGHLTVTCQMIGGVIGVEPWLGDDWVERFGAGSIPHEEFGRYGSKQDGLAMLLDAQQRVVQAVESLDDAALDAPFPEVSYQKLFPSVRHALTQVLVGHTAYHVAQLAVWRQAMDLPSMGRAFE